MKKLIRCWWHAALLGLFVGLPAGITLEFARRAYNQSVTDEITRHFESRGLSPPLVVDNLRPWAVPVETTIVFVLIALAVYALVARIRRVMVRDTAA